ncbi:MAG: gamma carbonic anhydrase family protein [Acidimicrobiia bacterium]|nr:gamma carbonic anhydrase family protein [bacterium]MYB44600.1 gamma carbonic anhydrase family protein [Acidimicrobiia bacterium]MYC85309.1 gamma carbonic anhydrase family protein [Acidimicrobiia bacterium]
MVLGTPTIHPASFVAPNVQIYGDALIEARAVIMFGVVIRAELDRVEVGAGSNLQDNVVMHCDPGFPCVVGRNTTVGHAAVLHSVRVGANCLVGIGSMALTGSELGEGAWLASGAVLPEGRSIPPWTLAMGIPAKPVRRLTEDEIERQRDGVATYQRFLEAYKPLLG